jgi:hypothetical protein
VSSDNWDDEFDWPIPLPGGGELVTFRDAGDSGLVQLALRQLPS